MPISSILAVLTISTLTTRCCEIYQNLPCPVIYMERKPKKLRPEDAFYGFDLLAVRDDWSRMIANSSWKRVAVFCSPNHFLLTPDITEYLNTTAADSGIELIYFSSDTNFSLSTAFTIVQSQPAFDAIIAAGSIRTASIDTAFSICKMKQHPELLSISAASTYSYTNFDVYEMDYRQLGSDVTKDLILQATSGTPLPKETLLTPKGFPYQFPEIVKGKPDTISMLTLDNPSTKALRKLLPMFEAISGIKVELNCVSYEDLHSKIDTLKDACTYDLIRIDVADFQPLGKELYMPLSQVINLECLPQQLYKGNYERYSVVEGIPYALPFDPSVQLFLYRRDLFTNALLCRAYYEEYRENLSVPTTFEQYLRIANFFTRSFHPDSPTQYGATTTYGSDTISASDFLPYYLGTGGIITDGNELCPINSPKMVQAMELYKDMQQYTCKQQWWHDSLHQFATGQSATTIVYSNYVSDVINTKYSKVIGQVGASILPGGHPLLGGGVIGVSLFSQKLQGCKQFFNWYYSDDIASMLVHLGGTSPLTSAYKDFRNSNVYPWLPVAEESTGHGTRGTDDIAIPGFTTRRYEFAIGTAIQKLLLNDLPPEHAAVMAQTLYDYR
ncbi:MAG: extracellular solute-binding protein [Bacteroidales bacterium]|nr:extracellular solute-binding protein [Bacteroidales bacterium]